MSKNSCTLGLCVLAFVEKELSVMMSARLVATVLREQKERAGLSLESRLNVIENSSSKIFSFSQQNGRMLLPSVCPG